MKKTGKKIIWISLGGLAVAGLAYIMFIRKAATEVQTQADKVMRETLAQKISATGTINPLETMEVGTQVSGTIEQLYVDFNDAVRAGQVVARMDARNLDAQAKESAANLARAEVQLDQAARILARTRDLVQNDMVAKVELEKAEDDHKMALATVNSAKLQVTRSNVNLGYATIRSPIDGIVIARKVDEGQTVASAFATPAIYVIAKDLKKMKIEASVDEADIGQVRAGQLVQFTVDAYPEETFEGRVHQIQLQPVTIQNVVTYTVEVLVDNPDLKLMPGMTTTLEVIVSSHDSVLTIPNGVFAFAPDKALVQQLAGEGYTVVPLEGKHGKTVWKQKGKAFVETLVQTGYSNGIKTEVVGGLQEGEAVVSHVEVAKANSGRSFIMPQSPRGESEQRKTKD